MSTEINKSIPSIKCAVKNRGKKKSNTQTHNNISATIIEYAWFSHIFTHNARDFFNDSRRCKKPKTKLKKQNKTLYTNTSADTDRFMVALEQTRGIFSRIHYYFTQMYSLYYYNSFSSSFSFFHNNNDDNKNSIFSAARSN